MDQKPSFLWALAVGLLFPILQVVTLLIGFGQPDAPFGTYLMFFLAGSLNGLGLIYFLRRSETRGVFRAVLIGFVISLPFAMFGMIVGGMIGAVGVFLLGVSPCVFITGVGYFLGRAFTKK